MKVCEITRNYVKLIEMSWKSALLATSHLKRNMAWHTWLSWLLDVCFVSGVSACNACRSQLRYELLRNLQWAIALGRCELLVGTSQTTCIFKSFEYAYSHETICPSRITLRYQIVQLSNALTKMSWTSEKHATGNAWANGKTNHKDDPHHPQFISRKSLESLMAELHARMVM